MDPKNNGYLEEEQVIEETLGGMDLNTIVEVWENHDLDIILEEYIQKIEEAYLIQEELK